MKLSKESTETYIITNADKIDPVTVYVRNYKKGQGKITFDCFGDAYSYYWGSMGENTLQEFFVSCDNDYILNKLLKETYQPDFDEINKTLASHGIDAVVMSDVEMVWAQEDIEKCFGDEWFMDLPQCNTNEYRYVSNIIDAIKDAFRSEG